jgi:hypothetical protein
MGTVGSYESRFDAPASEELEETAMNSTTVPERALRHFHSDHLDAPPARTPASGVRIPEIDAALANLPLHAEHLVSPEAMAHYIRAGERLGSACIDFGLALRQLFHRPDAASPAKTEGA